MPRIPVAIANGNRFANMLSAQFYIFKHVKSDAKHQLKKKSSHALVNPEFSCNFALQL
jgi:hypothetical protein